MSGRAGSAERAAGAPQRGALAVVYFTVFLDLLGFGIILPALPFYARDLGASGLKLGILFTSYSLAQLFGAAVLGRLSDRLGRRPILLASLAGSALAMVASGLAEALLVLCLARAAAGLFGGSIATAQAYIADVTRPEERARYMGLLGAAIGIGFVFGPALGAVVLSLGYGFAETAFVAAGLALVNLAVGFFKLTEPPTSRDRRRLGRAQWSAAFRSPLLRRVLSAMFLVMFAFVGMETTFAYFVADRYALDERGFGFLLAFVGMAMVFVQGVVVGNLVRAWGERRVAVTGASLLALALFALPATPDLSFAIFVLLALAVGHGLASPSLTTLLSRASDADEQGTVLGIGQSLSAAARASGPVLAGLLYDLDLAAPYVAGGLLTALAALLVAGAAEPA